MGACTRVAAGETVRDGGRDTLWLRLWRQDKGIAGLEAALILPFLVFFIFAVIETYQYFRVAAVLDRAVFSVADGIAMQVKLYDGGSCTTPQPDHVCAYNGIMEELMQPVDYKDQGCLKIWLFVAEKASMDATVTWGQNPAWSKAYGSNIDACTKSPGVDPPLGGMPTPQKDDTILVVKGIQEYEPFVISSRFWTSLGGVRDLVSVAYYRPRFDDLKTLN